MLHRLCTWLLIVTFGVAAGCIGPGPQGVIRLASESGDAASLQLIDQRPEKERKKLAFADCSNLGFTWTGVNDGAFSVPRTEVLRAKIANAFPGQFKTLTINRFQTCFLIQSASNGAALAGVSYAAALLVDALQEKNEDILVTNIEFDLDGAGWGDARGRWLR